MDLSSIGKGIISLGDDELPFLEARGDGDHLSFRLQQMTSLKVDPVPIAEKGSENPAPASAGK